MIWVALLGLPLLDSSPELPVLDPSPSPELLLDPSPEYHNRFKASQLWFMKNTPLSAQIAHLTDKKK